MKKRLFWAILIAMGLSLASCQKDDDSNDDDTLLFSLKPTGELLDVTSERIVTANEIIDYLCSFSPQLEQYKFILPIVINKDLNIASIAYSTRNVDGTITQASGIIAYPIIENYEYTKIVSIQHATCDIADAPSTQNLTAELLPAIVGDHANNLLSPDYFITVMADYLGYGISETDKLQHPYLHTGITGSTCADMLKASEKYIADKGLKVKSTSGEGADVDLVGYSQGGASTLATLIELGKRDDSWQARIQSVWAGAGPYDIPCFIDFFKDRTEYDRLGFIPFTFRGICYGEGISLDYSKIYNPNLNADELETLFSTKQLSEWHGTLGTDITKFLNPDFYKADYGGNAEIQKLMGALEKNSLAYSDNVPDELVQKIKLFHSPTDNTVPYQCSVNLKGKWECSDITNLSMSDHTMAGIEFMLYYCRLESLIELFSSSADL